MRARRARTRCSPRTSASSTTRETRSFELEDLEVQGGPAGRASGRYVATYKGEPDVTGTIAFNVLRDRGEPRIALISARQDVGS